MEYNIKTKTFGQCRVYPDNPNGLAPSVTSITGALMKYGLIDWAANCAVDYIKDSNAESFAETINSENYNQFNEVVDYYHTVWLENGLWDKARTAHERIRDKAADTGTDVHELCQLYLETYHVEVKNKELDRALESASDLQVKMLNSFKKWCEKNDIEPVHIEIKLHGDGYSGRCDLVAYRTENGAKRLGLYDIKTTPAYYEEQGLQLAAYAKAYDDIISREYCGRIANGETIMERNSKQISEIGIIRLDKKTGSCNFSEKKTKHNLGGKFTPHRERYTEAFMALKDFYWKYNDLQEQFKEIEK